MLKYCCKGCIVLTQHTFPPHPNRAPLLSSLGARNMEVNIYFMVPGLRRHAQPSSQRSLGPWERQVGGRETEGGSAQTEIQTTQTDSFQGTIL